MLAAHLQVKRLIIFGDSQVVIRQLTGEYAANDSNLIRYQALARGLLAKFSHHELHQIDRQDNSMADLLSRLIVSEKSSLDASVYFESLHTPTIEGSQIMEISEGDATWMTPIIDFLTDGSIPTDKDAAARVRRQASRYFIENNCLYKKSFDSPILKCIDPDEANCCMRETHEGICRDHMGAKALVHKIIRQGYF